MRWYPREWRARYGDEFEEMLLAEFDERPASWRRSVDIAAHGVLARLEFLGVAGDSLAAGDQAHASLAAFGCALGAFLAFGVALWAQLTVGWEWSAPNAVGTTAGMVTMSCAALALAVLVVVASTPVVVAAARQAWRGNGRTIVWPAALVIVGGALLVTGAHHFGNGWPGTHGHAWSHQGLVPGGVAAFLWAATLSISSYWAHPGALSSFPALEIAWMAVSPVAIVLMVVGAARIVRRTHLGPSALRFELRVAQAASVVMVAFITGASLWVLRGGPGPRGLFHTGMIDVAGLMVMLTCLGISYRVLRRAQPSLARLV